MTDQLIPRAEAKTELGLSTTTLWRLEKRGELEPTRIGARVFYLRSSLDRFLRKLAQKGSVGTRGAAAGR